MRSTSQLRVLAAVTAGVVLLAACTSGPSGQTTARPRPTPTTEAPPPETEAAESPRQVPNDLRQVLPPDAILPIYDPVFVAAERADYQDDTLVIGVEIDGAAKAYAVNELNHREMVNDSLAGIPILVTW